MTVRIVEIKKTKVSDTPINIIEKILQERVKIPKKVGPTYRELLVNDVDFLGACEEAGLPSGKHKKQGLGRQYGKWLRRTGLAYRHRK